MNRNILNIIINKTVLQIYKNLHVDVISLQIFENVQNYDSIYTYKISD